MCVAVVLSLSQSHTVTRTRIELFLKELCEARQTVPYRPTNTAWLRMLPQSVRAQRATPPAGVLYFISRLLAWRQEDCAFRFASCL